MSSRIRGPVLNGSQGECESGPCHSVLAHSGSPVLAVPQSAGSVPPVCAVDILPQRSFPGDTPGCPQSTWHRDRCTLVPLPCPHAAGLEPPPLPDAGSFRGPGVLTGSGVGHPDLHRRQPQPRCSCLQEWLLGDVSAAEPAQSLLRELSRDLSPPPRVLHQPSFSSRPNLTQMALTPVLGRHPNTAGQGDTPWPR